MSHVWGQTPDRSGKALRQVSTRPSHAVGPPTVRTDVSA